MDDGPKNIKHKKNQNRKSISVQHSKILFQLKSQNSEANVNLIEHIAGHYTYRKEAVV